MWFFVRSNADSHFLHDLSWVVLLFNLREDFLGNESFLNRGVMFSLQGVLRECLFKVRALLLDLVEFLKLSILFLLEFGLSWFKLSEGWNKVRELESLRCRLKLNRSP